MSTQRRVFPETFKREAVDRVEATLGPSIEGEKYIIPQFAITMGADRIIPPATLTARLAP